MSTFKGLIKEIPHISVDQFEGDNIKSTIYFLSHCHWDHMQGLPNTNFQEQLVNRDEVYLYASPVSCQILRGLFPYIAVKLKELSLENPTLIKYPGKQDKFLSVTPLPAGHCPGSVMFLFEFDKNILYTGDYRVRASDLKKYQAFYSQGKLKSIYKMYVDTTFFNKCYLHFPQRKESLDIILKVVKEWIDKSKKNVIHIIPSARYGSEYLFIELAKGVGMPIHVCAQAYHFYKFVPDMDEAVTLDGNKTQIHAGCGSHLKAMCIKPNDEFVRTVKPSAMIWKNKELSNGISSNENQAYKVCYSSHASYEEIEEFLLFLSPRKIKACVVPSNITMMREMMTLLRNIWKTWQSSSQDSTDDVKLFKVTCEDTKKAESICERDEEDSLDDILASPPKLFKRKRLD